MFLILPTGRNNQPTVIGIQTITSITQRPGEAVYVKTADGEQHAVNLLDVQAIIDEIKARFPKLPVLDMTPAFRDAADRKSDENARAMNQRPRPAVPTNYGPSTAEAAAAQAEANQTAPVPLPERNDPDAERAVREAQERDAEARAKQAAEDQRAGAVPS